ncbi:UvrABC system protein C [subsurface metagenome]
MQDLSRKYKFEEAENIKQKILLLERYKSKSTIVNPKLNNIDVFSFVEEDNRAFVNFLKVINGAIVQSHTIELLKRLDEQPEELLLFAIIDIREKIDSNALELLVPFIPIQDLENIKYIVPKKGDKKKLLELSVRNAKQFRIQKQRINEKSKYGVKTEKLLQKVKDDLQLTEIPKRIECFDNSNIQGANPVASCVVFLNGKPAKKEYRHFNIKTVKGSNDYASMEEIVFRRYKRLLDENKNLPQLIIIDGGKGQLHSAVKSLEKLDLYKKIPIIGIAKRLEEIFFHNDSIPIYIDKNSSTLKLIQNLRNEAHRFGIEFHRSKRSSAMIKNSLEDIKGVGKASIEKLMRAFKSVDTLKTKRQDEIAVIVGKRIASIVYQAMKTGN